MHLEYNSEISGGGEFVAAVVAIRRQLMRKRQRVTDRQTLIFVCPLAWRRRDVDNLWEICDGTDPNGEEF